MKINQWTLGLAAVGLVTLPSLVQAEEQSTPVLTALSATTISGYVNTSMHWDLGTGNAHPPGYAFNAGKQDGFNLDVVKVAIAKPLDEAQWAAGYNVELLFGSDANALATQSSFTPADVGIKQAYVTLRTPVGNGLDFKVGVFDTIIGYETFDAGSNPNYTRSYGYTIEPTTHTGVLASYQLNDMLSASVGIANTFGPTINAKAHPPGGPKAESYKTYMGSVAFTAPESFGFLKGSTLYGGFINGFNSGAVKGATDQTCLYIGGTLATPITNLKLGASYDYAAPDEPNEAYQNAVGLYLSFQATEKLSLHGRGEYASHSKGVVVDGFPSKVFEYTGTVQYDLWKNVLSRVEFRWDHSADGSQAFGGVTGAPTKKNALLIAANLIYKF